MRHGDKRGRLQHFSFFLSAFPESRGLWMVLPSAVLLSWVKSSLFQ